MRNLCCQPVKDAPDDSGVPVVRQRLRRLAIPFTRRLPRRGDKRVCRNRGSSPSSLAARMTTERRWRPPVPSSLFFDSAVVYIAEFFLIDERLMWEFRQRW